MAKTMVEQTKEIFESYDLVMESIMKSTGIDSITSMDDDSLIAFRDCLKLMDQAKDYSLAMAAKLDVIDEINAKLDRLIKEDKK